MNISKYDMRRNPVYQLNCEIQSKGRRVASTKRRVKWSFGFSDRDAIEEGKSGNECRGAEHEVVMVWSLTSGKQRVLADGTEVHFANCRVGDKFECEWTMNGGHNIKIVAHIAAPLIGQDKFRQYDLQIDGISYWDMPKIYQLGTTGSANGSSLARARSTPTRRISPDSCHSEGDLHSGNPSFAVHQEINVIRPRRAQSMVNLNHHVPVADLLSDEPSPSPSPSSDIFSLPSLTMTLTMPSPTSVVDPFAPATPQDKNNKNNNLLVDTGTYVYTPQPRTSWHYRQPLVSPDSSSVCSSSSRSIETAPPSLSAMSQMSPMDHALNSLINFDSTCQPMQIQSPSSTPFDEFFYTQPRPSPSAHASGTMIPSVQHRSFSYNVPQTVYAGY
jgi:hypothetical protein